MTNDSAVPRSHANQRSTTPTSTVASQTWTPLRTANGPHARRRGDEPADGEADQERGRHAEDRGDAVALVVRAAPEDDEHEHGGDVRADGDEALLHAIASSPTCTVTTAL